MAVIYKEVTRNIVDTIEFDNKAHITTVDYWAGLKDNDTGSIEGNVLTGILLSHPKYDENNWIDVQLEVPPNSYGARLKLDVKENAENNPEREIKIYLTYKNLKRNQNLVTDNYILIKLAAGDIPPKLIFLVYNYNNNDVTYSLTYYYIVSPITSAPGIITYGYIVFKIDAGTTIPAKSFYTVYPEEKNKYKLSSNTYEPCANSSTFSKLNKLSGYTGRLNTDYDEAKDNDLAIFLFFVTQTTIDDDGTTILYYSGSSNTTTYPLGDELDTPPNKNSLQKGSNTRVMTSIAYKTPTTKTNDYLVFNVLTDSFKSTDNNISYLIVLWGNKLAAYFHIENAFPPSEAISVFRYYNNGEYIQKINSDCFSNATPSIINPNDSNGSWSGETIQMYLIKEETTLSSTKYTKMTLPTELNYIDEMYTTTGYKNVNITNWSSTPFKTTFVASATFYNGITYTDTQYNYHGKTFDLRGYLPG